MNGVSSNVSTIMGVRMSERVSTRMRSCGRHGGIAGAALLVFGFAASPTWAVSCDGYVGGPDEAKAFWSKVSEDDLRACIAILGVNVRDEEHGGTPLHWAAAYNRNPDVIATLIEAGANVMARNLEDVTPLHSAAGYNGNPDVVTLLLDAGADIEARDKWAASPLHYAAGHNANSAVAGALIDADRLTPLHHAAESNSNPDVVTMLLGAGADMKARSVTGQTALHSATAHSDNPSVITALLAAGADVEATTGVRLICEIHAAAPARRSQKSSKRLLSTAQRRAMMALAPRTVQRIPPCLRRAPTMFLQPPSTTPLATHRPIALNFG